MNILPVIQFFLYKYQQTVHSIQSEDLLLIFIKKSGQPKTITKPSPSRNIGLDTCLLTVQLSRANDLKEFLFYEIPVEEDSLFSGRKNI